MSHHMRQPHVPAPALKRNDGGKLPRTLSGIGLLRVRVCALSLCVLSCMVCVWRARVRVRVRVCVRSRVRVRACVA